jgi:hypothetical protein
MPLECLLEYSTPVVAGLEGHGCIGIRPILSWEGSLPFLLLRNPLLSSLILINLGELQWNASISLLLSELLLNLIGWINGFYILKGLGKCFVLGD